MKCCKCGEDILHGDTIYSFWLSGYICEKCMIEWLTDKVENDTIEVAEQFGWDAAKYDARNEE